MDFSLGVEVEASLSGNPHFLFKGPSENSNRFESVIIHWVLPRGIVRIQTQN